MLLDNTQVSIVINTVCSWWYALQFLSLFLLVFISLNAFAKQEIIWYSYHQPPANFTHGDEKGSGFVQRVRQHIIEQLPQYKHHTLEATVSRMFYDMKHGQQVCFPALIPTPERSSYIEFSDILVMHYNVQVLMKKSLANKLGLANSVDLET
ncbi:hypothetical protein [Colwellia sp. MEBiC06753]